MKHHIGDLCKANRGNLECYDIDIEIFAIVWLVLKVAPIFRSESCVPEICNLAQRL